MDKEQLVIQEIHTAFDVAEDLLLKEAEETTDANRVTEDERAHVRKMVKLGFVNAEGVQEASQKMKTAIKNKKAAERILYYKRTYPFLKFLTVDKLNEICEKYNLIHAPVGNYIGKVPKKNLKEIAEAQELKAEDALDNDVTTTRQGGRGGVIETTTTVHAGLFIAAPEKDFNLDGLTKKGIRGYFKTITEKRVDDPIVFRYVADGIQVLSKWGLEANDEALANPLDN